MNKLTCPAGNIIETSATTLGEQVSTNTCDIRQLQEATGIIPVNTANLVVSNEQEESLSGTAAYQALINKENKVSITDIVSDTTLIKGLYLNRIFGTGGAASLPYTFSVELPKLTNGISGNKQFGINNMEFDFNNSQLSLNTSTGVYKYYTVPTNNSINSNITMGRLGISWVLNNLTNMLDITFSIPSGQPPFTTYNFGNWEIKYFANSAITTTTTKKQIGDKNGK